MRKSTLDLISIIGLPFFSVVTIIYGVNLQQKITLYETELQHTQKTLKDFQKNMAVMTTREELLELNKKVDYAGNILGKQQEQIDRLVMR